jgi:hypothetical protein
MISALSNRGVRFLAMAAACLACTTACGSDAPTTPVDAAAPTDAAADAPAPVDASDAAADVAPFDAAPPSCANDETYDVPPTSLAGWSAVLSQDGPLTLTHDAAHSHDDQHGPLGFCPANVPSGKRYLALVSARFETDQQDQNFTSSSHCVVDYEAPDPTFQQFGMCFSGGNHNIYVEVRDENDQRVAAGFEVFYGGNVDPVPDQGKPANEFPMNYPMAGHQDQRYGARAVYTHPTDGPLASDAVSNMRLPINHHVNYLLTFQVKTKP